MTDREREDLMRDTEALHPPTRAAVPGDYAKALFPDHRKAELEYIESLRLANAPWLAAAEKWTKEDQARAEKVMFGAGINRNPTPIERADEPGKKYDAGKPPMSLIPREALESLARVLDYGASKYGPHNWRAGMSWSRLLDAALRHVTAFADGEDRDPETGELHTAHALACLSFLTTYAMRGAGRDDRNKWAT